MKKIPKFKNEDEERDFWATHDSTEYVDWSKGMWVTFPNLKRSTRTISLRMSQWMLDELKRIASGMDVPYQSLMKVYLAERIHAERVKAAQKLGHANGTPKKLKRKKP
jgi:predicted DNA binding CopG/RHH family protein